MNKPYHPATVPTIGYDGELQGKKICLTCNAINALNSPSCIQCGTLFDVTSFDPFLLSPRKLRFVHGLDRRPAVTFAHPLALAFICIWMFGMMVYFGSPWITAMRVQNLGTLTQGKVINGYVQTGKNTTYYLTFQYQINLPNGKAQIYQYAQQVSAAYYHMHPGDTKVAIKYLHDDPATAQLAGVDDDSTGRDSALFAGVGFGLVWLTVTVILVYPFIDNWTSTGRLLKGELVDCENHIYKQDFIITVYYTFVSPTTGQTLAGKQRGTRNDLMGNKRRNTDHKLPKLGVPVAVYYVNDHHYKLL